MDRPGYVIGAMLGIGCAAVLVFRFAWLLREEQWLQRHQALVAVAKRLEAPENRLWDPVVSRAANSTPDAVTYDVGTFQTHGEQLAEMLVAGSVPLVLFDARGRAFRVAHYSRPEIHSDPMGDSTLEVSVRLRPLFPSRPAVQGED